VRTQSVYSRILMAGAFACLIAVGCSDSKTRRSSRNLLEQVELAGALYDQALALMSSPMYTVDQTPAPGSLVVDYPQGAIIDPMPVGQVHPQGMKDVQQAQTLLESALLEHGNNAGPSSLASANAMLGRVLSLRSAILLAQAKPVITDVRSALIRADQSAELVKAHAAVGVAYRQLIGASPQRMRDLLESAEKKEKQLSGDIAQAKAQMEQISGQIQEQNSIIETLMPQARQFRIDSQLGSGTEALERLERALELEGRINQANLAVAEMEVRLEMLQKSIDTLGVELSAEQARSRIAREVLEKHQSSTEVSRQVLDEQVRQIGDLSAAMESALNDTGLALGQAALLLNEAIEAMESAVKRYQLAQQARSAGRDLSLITCQADAVMGLAHLRGRQLALVRRLALLKDNVSTAYAAGAEIAQPAGVNVEKPAGDLAAMLPSQEQLIAAIKEHYVRAVELYQSAVFAAPAQQRWVYQGQLAAANIGLHRFTGMREPLDSALQTIEEALRNRKFSPYLTEVRQLEQQARKLSLQAPGAQDQPQQGKEPPTDQFEEGQMEDPTASPEAR